MATRIEEILGKDINSLKELREEIKRLQDSIANVDPATEEFRETTIKLVAAQEQLTSVTRAGKDANVAATDSIVGMEKEYKSLYNTYKMLTEEQRNSPMGKDMASQLEALSQKLNETKKNVGNFKDNIGHYSESIMEAFNNMGLSIGGLSKPVMAMTAMFSGGEKSITGSLEKMKSGIEGMSASMTAMGGPAKVAMGALKGVGAAMKALIANPVGATIMAIVVAFKALTAVVDRVKKAINDNEESQMKLKEAMANFQPVIDAVSNAFDKLGTIVVKVIGFIGDAFSKLREIRGAVTDFLGITKGAKNAIQEQNKVYKDIAKSQNELIKNKREYMKLNASDKSEVERLREEASETDNLVEKKKLLEQAKEIQAQIDERNIQTAQEELRILEEQSKLTANDAAMNEKLAQATANVANAQAQAAANMRMFNKQLNGTSGAAGSGVSALKNYREEAKKIYEETVEWSKTETEKLTEKYKEEKKLLERYHLDTTLLTKKYNADIRKIEEENAKKIKESIMALNTWKTESLNEYLNATLKSEHLATKQLLETQEQMAESFQNGFHFIWDNTDMFEDLADSFKKQFENMQLEGFDIKFPPDDFVMDSEKNLEEILHYVDNYFTNLKAKIKKQKQEIEDELSENRISEKVNAELAKTLEDETNAILKGTNPARMAEIMAQNTYEALNVEKAALEEELADFQGTEEKKLELQQRYYEIVNTMRENDVALAERAEETKMAAFKDVVDLYGSIYQSLSTVSNAFESVIDSEVKSGKITEEQAEKKKKALLKLEKVALAVNIAQIAASTAAGIMDVWKSYSAELVLNAQTAAATGPAAAPTKAALDAKSLVSAIAKTASLGATGAANIAAAVGGYIAKKNNMKDASSTETTASAAATPAPIDSTPYTYSRTLQTQEEEDAIYNKNYWVSVTDIESALDKQVKVSEETSF